mgnify:FL=1
MISHFRDLTFEMRPARNAAGRGGVSTDVRLTARDADGLKTPGLGRGAKAGVIYLLYIKRYDVRAGQKTFF